MKTTPRGELMPENDRETFIYTSTQPVCWVDWLEATGSATVNEEEAALAAHRQRLKDGAVSRGLAFEEVSRGVFVTWENLEKWLK